MRFGVIIQPTQVLEVSVRRDSIHAHENIHVAGDDDLFIPETLVEDINGLLIICRRECETCNGIKGHTVKEGPQIVEFINA